MTYTVNLMNGSKCEITDDEFRSLKGKTGLVHVPSIDCVINLSSVVTIAPRGQNLVKEDRSKQSVGMLHDGTQVIKQFGRWYCANGMTDENGRLQTEPDPKYYPEVQLGTLPSPEEYANEYKALPVGEWAKKLIGSDPERPIMLGERTGGGLQKL